MGDKKLVKRGKCAGERPDRDAGDGTGGKNGRWLMVNKGQS